MGVISGPIFPDNIRSIQPIKDIFRDDLPDNIAENVGKVVLLHHRGSSSIDFIRKWKNKLSWIT